MKSSPLGSVTEPSRSGILAGSTGTALAIVAGQAAAGLSLLVLARRLNPSEFGTYAILYTVGLVLGGLLDFGSSQFRTRELARGSGLDSFSSWLLHRAVWQLPVVALATAIAWLAVDDGTSLLVIVLLVSQGLTFPISLGWSGAVRALRSPALGTWLIAAGNSVLLAVVLAVPDRWLVVAASLGATGSWLVTGGLSWRLTNSLLGSTRTRWSGSPWAGSVGFGFFGLAIALQGLQVAVVGALAGSTEAGELAAVARWVQPVYLVAAAFSTQTFPSMAAAASNDAARRILRPLWSVAALGVVVAAFIVAFAPLLVEGLLGGEYQNSVSLLRFSAIAAVPVLFTQPLATFLQARRLERSVAAATIISVGASLVAMVALAGIIGATAAPLCSGLGQVGLLAALVRLSRPDHRAGGAH